ncbi:hypothetical protein EIL87_17495 [Saccharopolyspora rhizosphaerae]|uniref:Uncharacterized protein n=1 Tax=Saccharopolyspora rhizosphaerae TaxID=2492662 RepID=A0A3R8VD28_9PSEU|nr:hypothetical protein [Saccharopolyspora rhizosphaerae]RRO15076.1 hypothetical protein EIL87_17495 [Saccharopolyspora rhizosphaerae]
MAKSSAEHRAAAEEWLEKAAAADGNPEAVQQNLQRAQVHAMLALTQALQDRGTFPPGSIE